MTYYEILGVSPSAKDEEIRRAYQERIAELQMGEQSGQNIDRQIGELKKAFATLSNGTSRDIYYNLLHKGKGGKEKSGLELVASKGFGLGWVMITGLGYIFLAATSWLFCFVVNSFNNGVAYWLHSDAPYLVLVSRTTDPISFWIAISTLSTIGLLFARFSMAILVRVFKRLSRDY